MGSTYSLGSSCAVLFDLQAKRVVARLDPESERVIDMEWTMSNRLVVSEMNALVMYEILDGD
jgi:hypothetical protein